MKRISLMVAAGLILFLSIITGSDTKIIAADDNMVKLLPAPSCSPGFVIDKTALYGRESLYERINGESELYLPYGFEVLASARYPKKGDTDSTIEVDIYRMSSLLNAFGIYSNYRRKDDLPAGIGSDSFISLPLLLFYQDRFFVRIQSAGSTDLDREILASCARAVSSKLPAGKGRPGELTPFGIPSIVKNSERYIAKSLLGYEFFPSGIIADAVVEGERLQVFVMTLETAAASRNALGKYLEYLKDSGKKAVTGETRGLMTVETDDPLYGGLYIEQKGRHLVGAARVKSMRSAKKIAGEIQHLLNRTR